MQDLGKENVGSLSSCHSLVFRSLREECLVRKGKSLQGYCTVVVCTFYNAFICKLAIQAAMIIDMCIAISVTACTRVRAGD